MEVKATLLKPYTDRERMDFITEQNYRKGYKITESETALESWGYTDEELAQQRETQFDKEFFLTSLGYIRRGVSMADGSKKDFLSDLLPTIAMALNMNTPVTVLAYDRPDFTEPVTDWTQYQHAETATAQFIQECFVQLQNDFLPINEE